MEIGIITKTGLFVPCAEWKHIATAFEHDTNRQFLLCKSETLYHGDHCTIDIVGKLNAKMIAALFEFATKNGVIIEDVSTSDLEDELTIKRHGYFI